MGAEQVKSGHGIYSKQQQYAYEVDWIKQISCHVVNYWICLLRLVGGTYIMNYHNSSSVDLLQV